MRSLAKLGKQTPPSRLVEDECCCGGMQVSTEIIVLSLFALIWYSRSISEGVRRPKIARAFTNGPRTCYNLGIGLTFGGNLREGKATRERHANHRRSHLLS